MQSHKILHSDPYLSSVDSPLQVGVQCIKHSYMQEVTIWNRIIVYLFESNQVFALFRLVDISIEFQLPKLRVTDDDIMIIMF